MRSSSELPAAGAIARLGADHVLREYERARRLLGVPLVHAVVLEWPGVVVPATLPQLIALR